MYAINEQVGNQTLTAVFTEKIQNKLFIVFNIGIGSFLYFIGLVKTNFCLKAARDFFLQLFLPWVKVV